MPRGPAASSDRASRRANFALLHALAETPFADMAASLANAMHAADALPRGLDWTGAHRTLTYDELAASARPARRRPRAALAALADALLPPLPRAPAPDGISRRFRRRLDTSHVTLLAGEVGPSFLIRSLDPAVLLARPMKHVKRLVGHHLPVYCCSYDRSSSRVITGADDHLLKVWDARTGFLERTLRGHDGDVIDVVFLPGSDLMVSAANDSTVRMWNVATGEAIALLNPRWTRDVNSVAVSPCPDRPYVATGGTNGAVRLWRADALNLGPIVVSVPSPSATRNDREAGVSLGPDSGGTSPRERPAVAAGGAAAARARAVNAQQQQQRGPGAENGDGAASSQLPPSRPPYIPPTSFQVQTSTSHQTTPVFPATPATPPGASRTSLLVPDASPSASASMGASVAGIYPPTLSVSALLPPPGPTQQYLQAQMSSPLPPPNLPASGVANSVVSGSPSAEVLSVAFNAGGTRLVVSGTDCSAHVYAVENAAGVPNLAKNAEGFGPTASLPSVRYLTTLRGHSDGVYLVYFAHHSDAIATGCRDGTARIWRRTRAPTPPKRGRGKSDAGLGPWTSLVLDTRRAFAATGIGGEASAGNAARARRPPFPGSVDAMVWSLDDQRIVTSSCDSRIRVWDGNSGKLLHTLEGHVGHVYVLCNHPLDRRVLLSAGYDGVCCLWNIERGVLIKRFAAIAPVPPDVPQNQQVLRTSVTHILDGQFAPDGSSFAVSDTSGAVNIFSLDASPAMALAPEEQFFSTDYVPVSRDASGKAINEHTGEPLHYVARGTLCDSEMLPHPAEFQHFSLHLSNACAADDAVEAAMVTHKSTDQKLAHLSCFQRHRALVSRAIQPMEHEAASVSKTLVDTDKCRVWSNDDALEPVVPRKLLVDRANAFRHREQAEERNLVRVAHAIARAQAKAKIAADLEADLVPLEECDFVVGDSGREESDGEFQTALVDMLSGGGDSLGSSADADATELDSEDDYRARQPRSYYGKGSEPMASGHAQRTGDCILPSSASDSSFSSGSSACLRDFSGCDDEDSLSGSTSSASNLSRGRVRSRSNRQRRRVADSSSDSEDKAVDDMHESGAASCDEKLANFSDDYAIGDSDYRRDRCARRRRLERHGINKNAGGGADGNVDGDIVNMKANDKDYTAPARPSAKPSIGTRSRGDTDLASRQQLHELQDNGISCGAAPATSSAAPSRLGALRITVNRGHATGLSSGRGGGPKIADGLANNSAVIGIINSTNSRRGQGHGGVEAVNGSMRVISGPVGASFMPNIRNPSFTSEQQANAGARVLHPNASKLRVVENQGDTASFVCSAFASNSAIGDDGVVTMEEIVTQNASPATRPVVTTATDNEGGAPVRLSTVPASMRRANSILSGSPSRPFKSRERVATRSLAATAAKTRNAVNVNPSQPAVDMDEDSRRDRAGLKNYRKSEHMTHRKRSKRDRNGRLSRSCDMANGARRGDLRMEKVVKDVDGTGTDNDERHRYEKQLRRRRRHRLDMEHGSSKKRRRSRRCGLDGYADGVADEDERVEDIDDAEMDHEGKRRRREWSARGIRHATGDDNNHRVNGDYSGDQPPRDHVILSTLPSVGGASAIAPISRPVRASGLGLKVPFPLAASDWLRAVSNRYTYVPQLNDLVTYFPQGHRKAVEISRRAGLEPLLKPTDPRAIDWPVLTGSGIHGAVNSDRPAAYRVIATEIQFPTRARTEPSSKSRKKGIGAQKLAKMMSVLRVATVLQLRPVVEKACGQVGVGDDAGANDVSLTYFPVDAVPEFLVLTSRVKTAATVTWNAGDRFRILFLNEHRTWQFYNGRVRQVKHNFRTAPWEAIEVEYENEKGSVDHVSPWELEPASIQEGLDKSPLPPPPARPQPSSVEPGLLNAIARNIDVLRNRDAGFQAQVAWFTDPVDALASVPSYCNIVPCPLDLSVVTSRLKTGFYRCFNAFVEDMALIRSNAILFNSANSDIARAATSIYVRIIDMAERTRMSFSGPQDSASASASVAVRSTPGGEPRNSFYPRGLSVAAGGRGEGLKGHTGSRAGNRAPLLSTRHLSRQDRTLSLPATPDGSTVPLQAYGSSNISRAVNVGNSIGNLSSGLPPQFQQSVHPPHDSPHGMSYVPQFQQQHFHERQQHLLQQTQHLHHAYRHQQHQQELQQEQQQEQQGHQQQQQQQDAQYRYQHQQLQWQQQHLQQPQTQKQSYPQQPLYQQNFVTNGTGPVLLPSSRQMAMYPHVASLPREGNSFVPPINHGAAGGRSRPVTRNAAQRLRNLPPPAALGLASVGTGPETGGHPFTSPSNAMQQPFLCQVPPQFCVSTPDGRSNQTGVRSRGSASPNVTSPLAAAASHLPLQRLRGSDIDKSTLPSSAGEVTGGSGVPGLGLANLPKGSVDGGTQSCAGSTEAAGGAPLHASTSESRFVAGPGAMRARSPSPQSRTAPTPPAFGPGPSGIVYPAYGGIDCPAPGAVSGGGAAHSSMSVAAAESTISCQAVEGPPSRGVTANNKSVTNANKNKNN
jgi:WD40 repeat protein